jgi:diguanylate cyclase (GGDEF)-like protein/PAS domain S-box-containing protein
VYLVNDTEMGIIEQITTNLTQLLRGKKATPLSYDDYPPALELLVKRINELIYSFSEIWDFILPLSQGILSVEPPKASNLMASPFKELHSQLRTLVWQVQQVAQGDYNQRVHFMGEFSQAFNSMVVALAEKDRLIQEHIRFLENEAKKLRERESRYASAIKNALGGIFIFDPQTKRILEANEQFTLMMGYDQEETESLRIYDFYQEKSLAEEDLQDILGKSLHSITNRQYRRKDGTYISVDISTCWSESGKSSVVIVSVLDVTERNKAQEIAAKYKVLLENARDIILFAQVDGRIIEANKTAEDTYGYTRDRLLSMNIYDLHSAEERLTIEKHMQEALSGGIIFEANQVRKDGAFFPVEISAQGIVIGDETLVSQVIRDISERKRIEDNLRYFAYHDALTRVPNRFVLESTYEQITYRNNTENEIGALLLIDVDNFKFINDTFGHTVGDMVLVHMVSVLKENLREEDLLARLGGDEFGILLKNVSREEACRIAEHLRREVEKSEFSPDGYNIPLNCTISIGVAPIHNNALKFREVISRADYALYQSKEQGRNKVSCTCNEQLALDKLSETNELMILIKDAIKKNGIVLYFQPVVHIDSGKTVHHEALMRIVTETGRIIYPDKVIPVAERFGLMAQIDKCIMRLCFEALDKYPSLKLFVNLSGVSIGNEDLLLYIEENLSQRKVKPNRLGFEITETVAVKDLARADRWIRRLREKGCRFALDDFGIGFSSFSYLQYLSVDYVKIDGSYVHDLDKNNKNRALVQAMNTVARSLGKEVIAEFVDNRSVLSILQKDRVSHAQGYLLGRPEPIPQC